MLAANQNPEQLARYKIDSALLQSGWLIQSFKQKNIAAVVGVAIREYPTATGPADDFELDPFNKQGGLGKIWQLFGEETDAIINELMKASMLSLEP